MRRRRLALPAMHLHDAAVCRDNHRRARAGSRAKTNPVRPAHVRRRVLRDVRSAYVHAGSTRVRAYGPRRCRDLRMRWTGRLRHGKSLLPRSRKNRHRRGLRSAIGMYRDVPTSTFRKIRRGKKNLSRQRRLRCVRDVRPVGRFDRYFDLQQISKDKLIGQRHKSAKPPLHERTIDGFERRTPGERHRGGQFFAQNFEHRPNSRLSTHSQTP